MKYMQKTHHFKPFLKDLKFPGPSRKNSNPDSMGTSIITGEAPKARSKASPKNTSTAKGGWCFLNITAGGCFKLMDVFPIFWAFSLFLQHFHVLWDLNHFEPCHDYWINARLPSVLAVQPTKTWTVAQMKNISDLDKNVYIYIFVYCLCLLLRFMVSLH